MRSILTLLICLAFALPAPALAQESGSHPDLTARAANFMNNRAVADQTDRVRREACKTIGCLFIVNRSKDSDIVELRFDTVAPGAPHEPVWSNNALRGPIRPQRTAALMKFGDATFCALPVQVVLKDRRAGTVEELRGVMSLCKQPGADVFSVGAPKSKPPAPAVPPK